ncbi:hypothetical protein [Streptomyces sp. NBC_01363]|uniref:hypothetical protein n=1 Tax=Streptomyces sp. NBC_01363 TaxID=2903840 RepID=UPI00224FC749|nr:hypothetical protein [Streptomyces sp. NBC_01363]MCX4734921.1 hypothetical protein [Streptomyces sp. NBC_01363]
MNPRTPTSPTVPADPEASAAAEASDAEETVTKKAAAEDVSHDMDKAAGEALTAAEAEAEDDDLDPDGLDDDLGKEPSGLGAAAAAVAAAGLGVVALTGSWTGKIAAERETLIGQIKTSSGGTAAQQISEIYGDAWHSTALVNGLFALLALLVGVFALVRPAFGAPSTHPQPGWVRAVATAGIALGVLGLLISVGMYFDLIVALPTAGAAG